MPILYMQIKTSGQSPFGEIWPIIPRGDFAASRAHATPAPPAAGARGRHGSRSGARLRCLIDRGLWFSQGGLSWRVSQGKAGLMCRRSYSQGRGECSDELSVGPILAFDHAPMNNC
jgi:hypothetical protein